MRQFYITSPKFIGYVLMIFTTEGNLQRFSIHAELNDDQRQFLHMNLPFKVTDFELFTAKSKTIKVQEVPLLVTFEMFWNKYNYKVGKKDTEVTWAKTSEENQLKAYLRIPEYDAWVTAKKIGKLYPATYLNKERYNDELK